jgi:hypothetical protein
MALLKNAGITGSATGGLLLLLFLVRGGGTGPTYRAETKSGQSHGASEISGVSGSAKTAKTKSKKWPEEGPWKASRQYFAGLQPEEQCPALSGDTGLEQTPQKFGDSQFINEERSKLWCIPEKASVRAMIAIVPDPVHSHLLLAFDRSVEALQLSAEAMHYLQDRYWLPWQPQTPGAPQEPQGGDKSKQPGLLLFRMNGPAAQPSNGKSTKPAVLYVFLVAETSTAGIHGTQFSNAVQYVQQVCKKSADYAGCTNGNNISILGPTFSGSLASLRALTQSQNSLQFTAYSGTASSICAIHDQGLFKQSALIEDFSPDCLKQNIPPAPNLDFRSMVGDEETAVQKFLATLKDRDAIQCGKGNAAQVAILSEADTTYGGAAGIAEATKTDENTRGPAHDECFYTHFRYPREISSLRNAAASSEPPAVTKQSNSSDDPAYLPFTLADQQPNSGDEPPDFSWTQGPLSKEAVLMKFAAELRRGHYKYVGLIGTNVVDVLFLAKFLRSACPDVRLFIFDADLLFERDTDNAPYIGMLSISTYPLIGRDLSWIRTQQAPPRLPFADQFEQGLYNAAVLAMKKALAAQQNPPLMEVGADKFDPATGILPVWVTIAGTGGYWPVQMIAAQRVDKTKAEIPFIARMDSEDFSPAWWTLTLLLAAMGIFQAWMFFTIKPTAMLLREFSMQNAAPDQRFFFLNVLSIALALALATLITPAMKFGCNAGSYVWWAVAVGALAILALVCACAYLARLKTISGKSKICSATAWLGALLAGMVWFRLHTDDPTHYGFFFGYRAANLATGVSPLTPVFLLLVAIYTWGMFEIWRLRFDDKVRPRLNVAEGCPGNKEEKQIACSVNRFWLDPNYVVVFFLASLAWVLALHPSHPFHLIEKLSFGRLYEVVFCIVVALMLSSGLRLNQTWTYLHHLLLELERSPIGPSFSRLKGTNWSPVWGAGGQQVEWTNIAKSFAVLEQIKEDQEQGDPNEKDPKLLGDIQSANGKRKEIHDIIQDENAGQYSSLGTLFNELQDAFADTLKKAMAILNATNHAALAEDGESGKGDAGVVVNCCKQEPDVKVERRRHMEQYVALRYVAFIRGALGHIRLWLILQAAVFSLVLLSLNVYSFEPHRSLIWTFAAVFVILGGMAISVLMQIERNHVLSRITGSQPNELGTSFYIRIVMLGAVPLLTLLATHFPAIGHYLLSFLQPGMEALK